MEFNPSKKGIELKDFNVDDLTKMLCAVESTRLLHRKAVDTDVPYVQLKKELGVECPLCEFVDSLDGSYWSSCNACPWVLFTGKTCAYLSADYCHDSPASIRRLTAWADAIDERLKEAIHAERLKEAIHAES